MAKGTMIFRAQTLGATRAARDLSRAARRMRTEMVREFRDHADELTIPFVAAAPYDIQERDDYHLVDHIKASVSSAGRVQAIVTAEAISPGSGFDYLDVTRFGHRGTIRARSGGFLKFPGLDGQPIFAKETAGSHPGSDWVADAQPEGDAIAGELADRIGRAVVTRVL